MLCVLSPGEDLGVAWRGSFWSLARCGEMVASCRQWK
ncbi:hypothetical protein A2U01_0117022, partial [Trifolium medium]|nr:hypothetical protein [Trifolium medium]